MDYIKDMFQRRKKLFYFGGAFLVLIFVIFGLGGGNGDKNREEYVVEKKSIEQSVSLSGKVETTDRADLGFASSGRVAQIFVDNNESVTMGQILAQLEIDDLLADLKIKEANLKTSDIDLKSAEDELRKVTIQEDTKVANAYRTMLSDELEFVANSDSYEVDPPTVKGVYSGPEGQYKVRITLEDSSFSDYEISTFGLENTKREINETGSTPLGTRGLFVSFDANDISAYKDTTWYIDIPNKSSTAYLSNLNAYQEAENARALAIKNAKAEYDKLLTKENNNETSVALAEIDKIKAEIRKNTIYAPFTGKVTNIEKEIGENAGVGERVISILGKENLEVVLQVSELDVSRLFPTQEIGVKLDAFPGEVFEGILKTVNSRETEIDGVPVYEAFVSLAYDQRIKTGMSATGFVVLDSREDVLAIPAYFVTKKDGGEYVSVLNADNKTEERRVSLGLLGSDNMVEVLEGLDLGEKIVSIKK